MKKHETGNFFKTHIASKFLLTVFTVGLTIFQKEGRVSKQFSTVRAVEAFRMEILSNCLQAILKHQKRSKRYRQFQVYVLPLSLWSRILSRVARGTVRNSIRSTAVRVLLQILGPARDAYTTGLSK